QRGLAVEGNAHVFKSEDRFLPRLPGHAPPVLMKILVNSRSITKISTVATTIACVVDRPTPCVPPVVRRPKKQPTSETTTPNPNGFTSPCVPSTYHSRLCHTLLQYCRLSSPSK